jgi:hypothetical protein
MPPPPPPLVLPVPLEPLVDAAEDVAVSPSLPHRSKKRLTIKSGNRRTIDETRIVSA